MHGLRRSLSAFLALPVLAGFAIAAASATESGEWTIGHSDTPGRVHFSLEGSRSGGHDFSTSSDWNTTEFQGLDWSSSGKHDVRFTIPRDAGDFTCEGFLKDGEGAGLFTFTPNAQYSHQMEALGFSGVTDEKQIAFALHNVSLAFAREMKGVGIEGLDTDKLLAFRIFGVDSAFVNSLRAVGVNVTNADKLIAFRIHGVSPEFIKGLRDAGLNVTDSDKLIAFRIHGVSPEFVKELEKLGYQRVEPDQLIALRIHGVTPDYIERMRSAHGMGNLTLDQLVSLRIHGIE